MQYKAVVFDCFGVIYNDILKDLLKRHAINDPAVIDHCFEAARASDVGEISLEIFLAKLTRLTNITLDIVRAEMSDTNHLNLELVDVIKNLKPTHKIGMITDVDEGLIEPFLTNQNLRALFDVIVISSEVRHVKPDEEIFDIAVERLGVKPSEIIYIDNSKANTNAAKELGMTGILYEDMTQLGNDLHPLLTGIDVG